MINNYKNLTFLKSIKFMIFVFSLIVLTFTFFDIVIYKLTRSIDDRVFTFFKNFIDPISDIFDPLNVIIFCLLIIIFNINFKAILKNKVKLETIKLKTGFSISKIHNSFSLILLICKHFIMSLAVAGIMCNLIKYIFGVSRPKYFFLEGYDRFNLFNLEHKVSSFPSGHTQAAFTLAILLILYSNRYTIIILVIATLMALSRIFMSMHFPSDLIFGAYLGSIVPILLYDIYYKEKINHILNLDNITMSDLRKILYYRIFI